MFVLIMFLSRSFLLLINVTLKRGIKAKTQNNKFAYLVGLIKDNIEKTINSWKEDLTLKCFLLIKNIRKINTIKCIPKTNPNLPKVSAIEECPPISEKIADSPE